MHSLYFYLLFIGCSFSDLNTLVRELIRLVQQYSVPWEEKGEVLKKLKADYESKQRQLLIAIKHLEMIAMEVSI